MYLFSDQLLIYMYEDDHNHKSIFNLYIELCFSTCYRETKIYYHSSTCVPHVVAKKTYSVTFASLI